MVCIMEKFVLFKNGKAVGFFMNERTARIKFIDVCIESILGDDEVTLVDLDKDGETIAFY